MSQEKCQTPCKLRFKGIENFLRRVAYNLGNTPSQTEVKIISCIPIDVTDLQQRIVCLEKELCATRRKIATENKIDEKPVATVGRALQCSSTRNETFSELQCSRSFDNNKYSDYNKCSVKDNKSNISFEYHLNSQPAVEKIYERCLSNESLISKSRKYKGISNERVKNLFRKRKKKKSGFSGNRETNRGETQMVYYAQTDMHKMNVLSHSYLSDVFRKHHDPNVVVHEFSDTSHYSQPICRDVKYYRKKSQRHNSDICSCCHGTFHNLDVYMNDFGITYNPLYSNNNKKKVNLSNYVDLIPVREKPIKAQHKLKKDINFYPKMVNNDQYYTKNVLTKRRHNCPKELHGKDVVITNKPEKSKGIKLPRKYVKSKPKVILKSNQPVDNDSSQSCSINCGDVYVKHSKSPMILKQSNMTLSKIKNIDDDKIFKHTEDVHSAQLKTAINDCSKTETALNEIKRILQSVLNEVKNNALGQIVKEEKTKKDAIVQKGVSQNNVQRSTYVNSFTYNTSNGNNPYLVPYPGQIPVAQYCFPNIPYDTMNYPVRSASPLTCTCHKKGGLQSGGKTVATTSTNTDNVVPATKSKETEKLIKEIYKSVALNMEEPSKENSCEYDEFKSTIDGSMSNNYKMYDDTSTTVSKVLKKDVQVEALLSTITTNTTASNFVYTVTSSKSGYRSKSRKWDSSNTENKEKEMIRQYLKNKYAFVERETPDSVVSTESDDDVIEADAENIKDAKKVGIFKNILKSVFKKKKESATSEESSSDSDDSVTMYSEKAINTPQNQRPAGINFVRPPANRVKRRTPYLDQEYRRQWNEDLIFREKGHYTAKPVRALPAGRGSRPNHVYYRDYEARAAFVQPRHVVHHKLSRPTDANDAYKMAGTKSNERKNISWLKKNKLGIRCGKRWKNFILNN